jgi:hypothetical protein
MSLLAFLLVGAGANAFDGNRKGFVLGGGLGFAPLARWEVDVPIYGGEAAIKDENAGVALNLMIGYAWDERNMIVYEGNVAGFTVGVLNEDWTAVQGFNGASYYHYFGVPGKTAFITLGAGLYYFQVEDFDSNDPGGAFQLGGGYEFARHWQVGLYLGAGKTKSAGVSFDHAHLNALVGVVAF